MMMTSRYFLGTSAVALLLFSISGCAHKAGGTGIVGTWTSDMTTGGGQAVHMTDVFGADGTHVEKVDAAGGNIEMHFDYTIVDASSITLKYVSGTINGRPTPGQMVGMPQTVNYKLTGDTLSVSQPGKMTIQFTRS